MTIRKQLGKKRCVAMVAAVGCWVTFMTALISARQWPALGLPVATATFLGFIGGVLYLLHGQRCPNCQNNLGYTLQSSPMFWTISDKLRFCPFCGVSLDTEITQLPTDGPPH